VLFEQIPSFRTLTGAYEPSGIRQLPDGRFLLVEDEERHPLSLLSVHADGSVRCTALQPPVLHPAVADFWRLDDLEGVAIDRAGYLYAITSHSRNGAGDEEAAREKLVRFRIQGDRVVEPKVVTGLKRALAAAHPLLAVSARIREVKTRGGLNIEALEVAPDQGRLMLGFRSPLLARRAIVACLENADSMFETGDEPKVGATLATLDLDGNGIRGMAYVPLVGGYLVIGGPVARERTQFGLWFWRGAAGDPACRVSVPGLSGFEHAEGVGTALIDGQPRIIIVSDDGSRQLGRFARFMILDPQRLEIEPPPKPT
jgi:hypothetical protein